MRPVLCRSPWSSPHRSLGLKPPKLGIRKSVEAFAKLDAADKAALLKSAKCSRAYAKNIGGHLGPSNAINYVGWWFFEC